METKLVWVDLSRAERKFRFPLPVKTIGTITTANNSYCGSHDGDLEFCIRLSSDDDVAVDNVDGVEYKNGYPHVFIKRSGTRHEYTYQGRRSAFFLIYDAELKMRFEEFGVDFRETVWGLDMTPELAFLIEKVKELLGVSRQLGTADMLDTLSWMIVQKLFLQRPSEWGVDDPTEAAIHAAASHLQVHYGDATDFEALARIHGMSRRSFYRNWRKYYATSPQQYLTGIRMEHAQAMLERTTMRVMEISNRLGYSDPAYFISAFRRYFRTTPFAYRRTFQQ